MLSPLQITRVVRGLENIKSKKHTLVRAATGRLPLQKFSNFGRAIFENKIAFDY